MMASTPGDLRLQRIEAAAQWLQRMRSASVDERIVEEWLEWCQRDPLNQQAFDEMAAVWELTGKLEQEPAAPSAAMTAEPSRWRRMVVAASVAALALAGVAGWWWSDSRGAMQLVTEEYSSPVGANSVHTLADGSRLELGGGTRVTVAIGADQRRVRLHDGELFVTVRSDAKRPFLVDSGRLEVMATGTAFNVLRTSARTTVTVAEGSVEARYEGEQADTPNVQLQRNQQLVYPHGGHSVEVRQVRPEDVIAWRNMKLVCDPKPLDEIIATLNRYTPRAFVIDDARVAALTQSGTVDIGNIDGWQELMRIQYSLVFRQLPDGRRRIELPPGNRPD